MKVRQRLITWTLLALLLVAGCADNQPEQAETPTAPTPTPIPATAGPETPAAPGESSDTAFITVATDAPSRLANFGTIDEFGTVVGFDADVMATLAAAANLEYEFVVTNYDGLLASVARGDFDTAMSAILIPAEPVENITFTDPYYEVGQVLVVRANELAIQTYQDIQPGTRIGALAFSSGEEAAQEMVGVAEADLVRYDTAPQALQELYNGAVDGVIIDHQTAARYTTLYPQALKLAGGSGRDGWISAKAYAIAVASNNEPLLNRLNEAITQTQGNGQLDQVINQWLVPQDAIAATESLIGTPPDELVIGVVGDINNMDPAANRDVISWEVKINTMSGLLMYNIDDQLVPVLAADLPTLSADNLEYTFTLRPGLTFPDGSPFDAEDVRRSLLRAAYYPNFLVNDVLKDADDNSTADDDAIQVIDPLTVKIVLDEPTGYFLAMLATPPFFIVNEQCITGSFDPTTGCGGIGPYRVAAWERGVQMRLEANPTWPGTPPAFAKIQLRFYQDAARIRRSLENNAIDLAWTGMPTADIVELRQRPGFTFWQGPPLFKSYLVFEQSVEPWDDVRIRQAAAYAVDRQALVTDIFDDIRQPLFSPVPTTVAGHVATLPQRDLERARQLLTAAGHSAEEPVETTLWYISDGRYTPLEEAYATAIKTQLEETGMFRITLRGEPWQTFIGQVSTCNAPSFLLGWPPSGSPPRFLDALDWMEYFVTATDTVCSNYESEAMTALLASAVTQTGEAERLAVYDQMQRLWATELPTLDLTQAPLMAISLSTIGGVEIDGMGFLHYDLLTKASN
jgi:peptide/nickel transport system substrate-binding protein